MSGIQDDPSRRDQQENLPQSLRRIAVGLTGLHKRLILDLRKILRRYKSPLLDSLAANLATLLPVAGAQSQTSCPSITGEVTSPPTVGANQKCTIQSSGSIAVDTAGTNNTAVNLSAGPARVNRGTVTAESVPNSLAPPHDSERCAAAFAIAARSFNSSKNFLTWASVRLCLHWLSSQLFACPAARVASFGNRLPRPGRPRTDAPTGRTRAGRFRFLCALALLFGALSSFATAPAAAQGTTPGAPTGLTVTACPVCLDLSWTAPTGTVTGYDIHITTAAESKASDNATELNPLTSSVAEGWISIGTDDRSAMDTSTSQRVPAASTGVTRVRVRAKNSNGVGPWVNGTGTGDRQAPPTNLSVTAGNGRLTLTWTAPDGELTRYELDYTSAPKTGGGAVPDTASSIGSDDTTAWIFEADVDEDATSHTITGLTNGRTYRVRLRPIYGVIAPTNDSFAFATGTPHIPSVSLSVSPNPVTEGSPVTVTVSLIRARSSDTVVPLTLTNGSAETTDYGSLASITIAANALSNTGQITTAQDTDADDETFTVALGTLPSGFVKKSPASIEVTILDDEAPPRVSLSASPNPVTEGSPVTVTASLSKTLSSPTVIPLTLTKGSAEDGDYGTLANITIAASALSGTGDITTVQDTDAEDETFTVALGALPTGVAERSPNSVEVTILDGDKAPMAPTDLVVTPGNEQLALGWKQPADERTEVAAVTGYDVEYSLASVSVGTQGSNGSGVAPLVWTNAGYGGSEHTHMITNLVNNELYRVRVRADNGKAKSGWTQGVGIPSNVSEDETAVLKQSLEALTGSIMGSAVSTVSARVESLDQPSQPLAGDAKGGSSALHTLSNLFGLPQPGDPSGGVENAGHDRLQAHRAHRDEVISPAGRGPGAARYASGRLRLNSFSFSLDESSDAGASGSGGARVLWGSADDRNFSGGDRGTLSYSGSWTSLYLGMDQDFGEGRLAGLALSAGRGKVNYRYGAGDSQIGRYEARLKAVYPYFSARVADGTRLWATVGLGRGDIKNYQGTAEVPGTGDLRLGLAAAGVRHELNEWPMVRLSAVGDAAHARLKVMSSVRQLVGLQAKVNRLRAGLEVSGKHAAAPYLRVSARYERGESSEKKGLEAEGGVRWSAERYRAEIHARTLRLRGNSRSVRESGAGASVYFSPRSDGTGASLSLSHDWGRSGGSGTLWQDNPLSLSDSQSGSDPDSARSLNAELGYGLYSERLLGLVTPKLGWREDSGGERRLRIGAAYRANSWLNHRLGVEFGIHRRSIHRGVADYGGDLNALMSW